MLDIATILSIPTLAQKRASHQRNVGFQQRFAMENYLQDQQSELSPGWIEASDDAFYVGAPGSLLYVMLYGC